MTRYDDTVFLSEDLMAKAAAELVRADEEGNDEPMTDADARRVLHSWVQSVAEEMLRDIDWWGFGPYSPVSSDLVERIRKAREVAR